MATVSSWKIATRGSPIEGDIFTGMIWGLSERTQEATGPEVSISPYSIRVVSLPENNLRNKASRLPWQRAQATGALHKLPATNQSLRQPAHRQGQESRLRKSRSNGSSGSSGKLVKVLGERQLWAVVMDKDGKWHGKLRCKSSPWN
jgi:hypothetical protein